MTCGFHTALNLLMHYIEDTPPPEDNGDDASDITAVWLFTSIARKVPRVRILDLTIHCNLHEARELAYLEELVAAGATQEALKALTNLNLLSLTMNEPKGLVQREPYLDVKLERWARTIFRVCSIQLLELCIQRLDTTSSFDGVDDGRLPLPVIRAPMV
ncbi:hypothetical protein EVG20_g6714 [Dentipellis fragilis]|uniref:Uncharacterized protein n=1 Tax=Dentipellis fragilis TaxID=205917 RepID=A0A4Y9YJU0_9AGAM|nr:hypothetical protein EVG20_g6714 [Dentipellis fragilis]